MMNCLQQLLQEEAAMAGLMEGDQREPKSLMKRLSRCPRIRVQKSLKSAQGIGQAHGGRVVEARDDDGEVGVDVVRVKIVVTKRQLRQMVASLGQDGHCNINAAAHQFVAAAAVERTTAAVASASNVEQLLHVLRRRHTKRAEAGKRRGGARWRPALQSIPEEIIQD